MTLIFRRQVCFIATVLVLVLTFSTCSPSPKKIGNVDIKQMLVEIEQDMQNKQLNSGLEKAEKLILQYPQVPAFHLVKAKLLKELDREQQALDYLTRQINNNPENTGMIAARGQFLLENGYVESAQKDFLQAYQKNYRSAEILKVLAAIARRNGSLKQSLNLTTEALKLDSKDHELWFNKAHLELRMRKLEKARQSVIKAMQLSDKTLKYHQLYIEILGFVKDAKEINRHITRLVEKFPDEAWVSIRYATLLYSTNEQLKARTVLQQAIEKHPRNYLLLFQLATIHAAEKNWQGSIDLFLRGLKEKPDSTWAKVQLSKVLFQAGQANRALQYLQQARAEKSPDPFVYETLAKLYNRQNDTFEAEDIILDGLAINRKNQTLILEYASLLEKRANYKEAVKAYEKALSNSPQDHLILGKLGNLHRLLSNFDKSKTYFQRSIDIKSDASWVRSYYVELLSDMESWDEALVEIDKILEITPNDYWAYAKKAQIENELEAFEKAIRSIKTAIRLRPDAPWLKEIEANSLESLKQYGAAEKSYKAALGQTPDNAYLLTRLAYVQLHLDRKKALKTTEKALDSEDFDISTIELYLYLTGQSRQFWGFRKNSLEASTYKAIIHKQFDQSRTLLKSSGLKDSSHLPFLTALSRLLKKEDGAILSNDPARLRAVSDWHYFYLGMNAMREKEWQDAKQFLLKGLSINQKNIWLMIKLAYVHQHLEEYESSVSLLKAYLAKRTSGDNIWVKLRLALNYDLSRQYVKAEAVYKKILAANPGDNVALNNLAWMYLTAKSQTMHKVDEALNLSLQAVKLSPSPANLDTLAEAYYQKKEYHKALKAVERALDRDRMGLDDFKKTKKKILKAIQSKKD